MPKLKTNRGAAKKSTKRKRSLRSPDLVEKVDTPAVRKMLPYV